MAWSPELRPVRRRVMIGIGSLACWAIMTASPIYANDAYVANPNRAMLVFAVSLLGAMASLMYLWIAVRCPRCGHRLFAEASRKAPAGSTLRFLMQGCPACGFGAMDPHERRGSNPSQHV